MVATEKANSLATYSGEYRTIDKTAETEVVDATSALYTETACLLPESHEKQKLANGSAGYQNHGRLDIQVTWRNWLIGPVCFMTFFAMVSSYYCLVEYTNHYVKVQEFSKANLSLDFNTSASVCSVDPDDVYYRTESRATSAASTWSLYYSLGGGLPSVAANLLLGAYTDALGRRFLLLVGIFGSCVRLVLAAVVVYMEYPLYYIVIACVIEGCSGQHAAILLASLAYVADITDAGKGRIFGIVYIEIAVGIGLSSATFVTGFIIDAIGYEFAMIISAGVLVFNFIVVLVALPETFTKKHRKNTQSAMTNLKNCFRFFVVDDASKSRWKYQIILASHVLSNLSFLPRLTVETLYQLASPFCWSPTRVGVYAAVRTLAVMTFGLGSVKLLQRCLGDITISILGNLSYAGAFFWQAFVSDDVTWYFIIAVGCFGPLSITMQRSMLSHLTPAESQGAIFTAVGVIEVASFMVTNVSTAAIYAATISYMRGFVFLTLGSYDILSIVLLIILKIGWYREKKKPNYHDPAEKEILVGSDNYGTTHNHKD